ncbi:hypothetical protein MIMGU_mgv11b019519mg [Erythranthe guttata]|uniref:C2 domain-containing protein n=1 Tax=Erythranthe guttata TaxID=4155 RepID=A0A022Q858_ERYGU|nr:hypothetical protein MIMGU_mgv11b019519mg [Erythranthe guttata]
MQSVETRIVTNDVHPIWDEVLTIYVSDPSRPVSLTVREHNKLSNMDNKMGNAVIDIKPLVQAVTVHQNGLPNGTVITRLLPSSSNCLSKESSIVWENGRVIQDMCLRLENAECGQVELQLGWID